MKYSCCKLCNGEISVLIASKNIVQCNHCQLIFWDELLDDESSIKLYNSLYTDVNKSDNYRAHIAQQQQLQQNIQPNPGYNREVVLKKILKNHPQQIAELGAGVGVIAKYLTAKGINYSGFELDEAIALKAQEYGVNIQPAGFEYLKKYDNYFDAVIAFEVIEHIDHLKNCLELIWKALKPNGCFGFTVPNFNKRNNFDGDPDKLYQPNPPVHVNFFTIQNVEAILPQFQFTISFLQKRLFPDINLKSVSTYKNLLKSALGKYEGSTIMCVCRKKIID